jgi:hypothetical protein
MSINFTKLFSSITESTIWCEPDHVRIVWITMLAMADRKGRVWGSIPGLAGRARVSIDDVELALKRFQEPDKYSRTKDCEGKRIETIKGGWRLLNYLAYRDLQDEESIREYKRKWMREKRAKLKNVDANVDKKYHSGNLSKSVETSRSKASAKNAVTPSDQKPKHPLQIPTSREMNQIVCRAETKFLWRNQFGLRFIQRNTKT